MILFLSGKASGNDSAACFTAQIEQPIILQTGLLAARAN
jgi:hypothetical protein